MLNANKIHFGTTMKEIKSSWVIYTVRSAITADIKYIGCCKFAYVMSLPDFKSNTMWRIHFADETPIIVQINEIVEDKKNALRLQNLEITKADKIPPMNMIDLLQKYKKVKCVTTGEIFQTAADAARMHQISPSNLSNHLRKRTGFNTIKNRTYERIM